MGTDFYKKQQYEFAKISLRKLMNSEQFNSLSRIEKIELFFTMANLEYLESEYNIAEEYMEKILKETLTDFDLDNIYYLASLIKYKLGKEDEARLYFQKSNNPKLNKLKIDSLLDPLVIHDIHPSIINEYDLKYQTIEENKI